ncbi:C-signal-like, partial [Discoglossus pictus]
TPQELRKLAEKHQNLRVVALDATEPASVRASFSEVQKHLDGQALDLLINNAGVLTRNTLETQTKEDMMEVYSVNVVGPMLVTQAFLPLLKRSGGAHSAVVHVSALLGSISDVPDLYKMLPAPSYRCSKAAMNMLSRCQAEAYREDGLITIAIHPGWVQTDMGGNEAPLTKEVSVSGMMKIIYGLNEAKSGTFVDWKGETLPW